MVSRRLSIRALATVVAAVAFTGCLAPDQADPTGHAPFGNLELVAQSGSGVKVVGWAIDPDTSAPVDVHVRAGGLGDRVEPADRSRPDVGAAYPDKGGDHGFDVFIDGLGAGRHQVCVWVPDVGAGGDTRMLGCRDVVMSFDPFGNLEAATGSAESGRGDGIVRVVGWVADPETTDPTDVGVVLDGTASVVRPTDVARPDVAAAFRLGLFRGFDISVPAPTGRHRVCIVAGNVGSGSPRFVGCSDVVVQAPSDRRPDLRVDSMVPMGGSAVRILGTATDPDSPGPVTVHARVDLGPLTTTITEPDGSFELIVSGLGPGTHQVCVIAVDIPGTVPGLTGDRLLPCTDVTLER